MKKSIKNKILASVLIFVLGISNFQGIITEGLTVLASSIENQTSETNHKNVDFNAQFMVINNEKKYSIRENISNDEIYLNIFAEIKEAGYLKSGKVSLKDKNENKPNFKLVEIEEPITIQSIDYINNEIILNQLNNGEKLDVNIPIELVTGEIFDLDEFSKDTVVTFNGIYVDGEGKERNIEKEINLRAEWNEEVEAVLTGEVAKVLPYELEEKKGIVIAENIKLGVKDFKLPIKVAELEITVPKIGDILPLDVRVENINTSLNISKEYKDGKLNLKLENTIAQDNTVNWSKSLEELEITYIFENLENIEVQEVQSAASLNIECYSSEKTVVSSKSLNTINIVNKLGESIEEVTENISGVIYKGNMLNTSNETEFKVESNIDIAYEKLEDKVEVKYSKDKFVIGEKEIEANTYYKSLILSKENFDKILGETGELKVYSGDVLLSTINNGIADENGNIVFTFENNLTNELKIETSKPIYSGILKIEFVKAINGENTYSKDEIKNITNLKLSSDKNVTIIEMVNPITKIGIDTNTNILSTVVENKGVEFRVTLNNNNINLDLFKNPQIELRLPEAVTDLKINCVELLLEDELVIKNYEYMQATNSIVINLEGMQTKYNLSETTYGATVIVNTDITLDKLAINKKDKVKLFVINELSTSYESVLEEKGYSEKDINIVAPLGLIALNSAEVNDGDTETSISGNEAIGKIEPNAEMQIATMKITAINNYDSIINNIRILGRIPFAGNKSLVDGTDLGTTFDVILKEKISSELLGVEKFDVYYSENGDATEDLKVVENEWVLEPEDLSKVKSYLIVLKDYEMQIGEKLEFKYDIEVPAGLELGNSAHGTYIIYYDNKKDDVVFENISVPSVIGLTTGEAPKLEIEIKSDVPENEPARSGQIIKYTIKVKNVGEVLSSQVFVTSNIPEGVTYTELVLGGNYSNDYYKEYPEKKSFNKLLNDIKPGEEQIVEYAVKVNEKLDMQKEIKTKAQVSAKNLPEMIESTEIKNIIDNGSLFINLTQNIKTEGKIKVGEKIELIATVVNISNHDINNTIAKIELPKGLQYESAYVKNSDVKADYDLNTKTIQFNLGKLLINASNELVIEAITNNEAELVEIAAKVSGENVAEHKSNIMKFNICKPDIIVKQESNIPEGFISAGDMLEYKIEVSNTGSLDAIDVQILDYLPDGMKYIETTYEVNGEVKTVKTADKKVAKIELNVPENETVIMNVKAKANDTDKELQATNIVKVINDGKEKEANKLTHIIEAKTIGNNQNEANSSVDDIEIVDTYKISGTAWLDKNENGIKDDEESVLAGITVMLLDKQTGNIAKDYNGQELNTTTEGTGLYTFRNLKQGEYIVVFLYDNSKYVITDYKKAEVEESKNSDVVNMKISMNEEEKEVAVSDTLVINDANIYNINIGLKEVSGFDLKLDKYVSKITVNNSQGSKTYDYSKLAKIELDSKIANESILIIEYKLAVTNEGGIAGYAKKIVDYIPADLKFSSELNTSWYLAEDGNVYSSELSNSKINPGETKEVTLVLTKQVQGENIGLINNNAEIIESYNDYGIADTDSLVGNKQSNEDDTSNADIYIGVKTGSPVTYIGLSIIMMMVLGAGAYLINTKILIKE